MSIKTPSLRRAILTGSSWTLLGVGAGQLIRLLKSLILTRLLFPEAYGVMAIVWSTLFALGMLSDAGLSAAAIRHARAGESNFINTLWTMKVVRGLIIFGVTCLIAYPMSVTYQMPDLTWLIPIAGFTMVINSFDSTNVYRQQREMNYGRLILLELSNDLLGLLVMMTWAYVKPGVGAMIGAAVVCAANYLVASHLLLPGERNRFAWDRDALRDIFHFGKWILFSSVVFLVYTQGDRMLLGHYLDTKTLGVYSIAVMIVEMVTGVIGKLNNTVLYPALSRVIHEDRNRLCQVFYKTRLGLDFVAVAPIGALMVAGGSVMAFMYDTRYANAGWILQILCVRLVMSAMLGTSETCLLALGKPKYSVFQNLCRAIWILVGIPLMWPVFGLIGVVWVIATTEVPVVFVLWQGMAKENLLSPLHELRSVAAGLVGMLAGALMNRLFF